MTLHILKSMPRDIFRANDIRGDVNERLTVNAVYTIGLALGAHLIERKKKIILVGRDARFSSPLLSRALIHGLIESGCDVIDLGAISTPVLYFATHTLDAHSGVMITGSHNPINENGLKVVIERKSLSENELIGLYDFIQKGVFHDAEVPGRVQSFDILPSYFSQVTSNIQLKKKLRVVIDCGNSIVGKIAPQLMRQLGCEVVELFCHVEGDFPNHHPDPSVEENLQDLIHAVKDNNADIGLAYDGDGDRLGVVSNGGAIIWPDRILMLLAKDILLKTPDRAIIFDVKCTGNMNKWISDHGGVPFMWKTGHAFIKRKIQEMNAALAGEMSGHIYFPDDWFGFDDATYASARLLQVVANEPGSVDDIFLDIPNNVSSPEFKISIDDDKKFDFIAALQQQCQFQSGRMTFVDGVRVDYDTGFGVVRASNTTPCIIIKFGADNKKNLATIQQTFKDQLLSLDGTLTLPF